LVVAPPSDDLRVTLDEPADAELLDALVAQLLDRPPSWQDVVAVLRLRPEIARLNAAVHQRQISEG
jgi:spore coat polysaccharide biosynthesis protein SpsF